MVANFTFSNTHNPKYVIEYDPLKTGYDIIHLPITGEGNYRLIFLKKKLSYLTNYRPQVLRSDA